MEALGTWTGTFLFIQDVNAGPVFQQVAWYAFNDCHSVHQSIFFQLRDCLQTSRERPRSFDSWGLHEAYSITPNKSCPGRVAARARMSSLALSAQCQQSTVCKRESVFTQQNTLVSHWNVLNINTSLKLFSELYDHRSLSLFPGEGMLTVVSAWP